MGCDIEGFVGKAGVFQGLQLLNPCITVAPLAQGLEYLVCDWPLMKVMPEAEDTQKVDSILGFNVKFALTLSVEHPIAYVEAYFSGGTGSQTAAVWHQNKLVLLPPTNGVWYSWRWEERGLPHDAPINTVLRFLGVKNDPPYDEYVAVGLTQVEDRYGVFAEYNTSPDKDHCFDEET